MPTLAPETTPMYANMPYTECLGYGNGYVSKGGGIEHRLFPRIGCHLLCEGVGSADWRSERGISRMSSKKIIELALLPSVHVAPSPTRAIQDCFPIPQPHVRQTCPTKGQLRKPSSKSASTATCNPRRRCCYTCEG